MTKVLCDHGRPGTTRRRPTGPGHKPQPRSAARDRCGAGFTLVELLIALAVSGVLSAIALANIDLYMRANVVNLAARQVLNDLQATRMVALSRNRRYRVVFTANGTTYVQQMRDPTTLGYATVANFTLPPQSTFGTNVANPVFMSTGVINVPAPGAVVIEGQLGLTRTINMTGAGSIRLAP